MDRLEESLISARDTMRETRRDSSVSKVLQFVLSGWPEVCDMAELKQFWSR